MMRKEFRFIAAGVRNSDSGFGSLHRQFLQVRYRRMPPAVRKTPLFRGHAALKSGMCPHQQLVDEVQWNSLLVAPAYVRYVPSSQVKSLVSDRTDLTYVPCMPVMS